MAAHTTAALEARLALPMRGEDDWSIELPDGCRCELCHQLQVFLHERSQRTLEWPLAQDRRAHVHRRIDASELPVNHQTRRQGRPYTLVLTKTDQLLERERQHRHRDEADRAWLNGNRSTPPRRDRQGSQAAATGTAKARSPRPPKHRGDRS